MLLFVNTLLQSQGCVQGHLLNIHKCVYDGGSHSIRAHTENEVFLQFSLKMHLVYVFKVNMMYSGNSNFF